jgi:AraC-like DNA-binding protein
MSLDLTIQEINAIWTEAEQHCPPASSIDRLETIHSIPSLLGNGYRREMELYPGLELCIFHETYHDLTFRGVENQHLVQFMIHLSGIIDSGQVLYQDATQSYIGGSGIQKAVTSFHPAHLQIGVNIHLQPLVRGNDWQQVFSPKVTGAMRLVVQQIIDCPFLGAAKQIYLQGKVFELMALQLHAVLPDRTPSNAALKPSTIARIHHAAEILRSNLEHPLSQTELAQRVGVSDRTLRRGFQALFGTTVLGYLTERRLIQAEQLLQQGLSVAEVVHRSGYSNQGHFAAAFKRKFGMTPKQCAIGKKLV